MVQPRPSASTYKAITVNLRDKGIMTAWLRTKFEALNSGDGSGEGESDFAWFERARGRALSYCDIVRYYTIAGAFVLYYNNKKTIDVRVHDMLNR